MGQVLCGGPRTYAYLRQASTIPRNSDRQLKELVRSVLSVSKHPKLVPVAADVALTITERCAQFVQHPARMLRREILAPRGRQSLRRVELAMDRLR